MLLLHTAWQTPAPMRGADSCCRRDADGSMCLPCTKVDSCFSSLLNEPALDVVMERLERVSTPPLACKLCLHSWQMRVPW